MTTDTSINKTITSHSVLIIDDEPDLCLLLHKYFTRRGAAVAVTHSLHDGLQVLESMKPSALLLDNNLPDGLGWEHALQIAVSYPKLTIVLISAFHLPIPELPLATKVLVLEKPIRMADLECLFD